MAEILEEEEVVGESLVIQGEVPSYVPATTHIKSPQVIENDMEMVLATDELTIPDGLSHKELLHILLNPIKSAEWKLEHPEFVNRYLSIARLLASIRHKIASHLLRIAKDPTSYGVELTWKETQLEALADLARCYRLGYHRLPIQLPTGSGKSHILGAIARATYEAYTEVGIDAEMILTDPMENLARQLGDKVVIENKKENDDSALLVRKIGDVRKWLDPVIEDDQVRIVVGDKSDLSKIKREKAKPNPVLTAQVTNSLNLTRIDQIHRKKTVSQLLVDEGHTATERLRAVVNQGLRTAHVAGASATIYGPQRDPFLFYERIHLPEHRRRKDLTWEDQLACHATRETMINRIELKPLRVLAKPVSIDISQIKLNQNGRFSDADVWKVFSRNLPALEQFLREVLEEDNPVLAAAGALQARDRTLFAPVKNLDLAEHLAEFCTKRLHHPAEWISGLHTQDEFDQMVENLASGKTRILFGCRKTQVGFNCPAINGFINGWPHPWKSKWMFDQELGRAMRWNPLRPNDDCLCIQPEYELGQHRLATAAEVFGQKDGFQGGLVVAGAMRELENKILAGFLEGLDALGVLDTLNPDELDLAERLGWRFVSRAGKPMDVREMDTSHLTVAFDASKITRWERFNAPVPSDPEQYCPVFRQAIADRGFKTKFDVIANPNEFRAGHYGSFGTARMVYRSLFYPDNPKARFTFTDAEVYELADRVFDSTPEEDLTAIQAILRLGGIADRSTLLSTYPDDLTRLFEAEKFKPFHSPKNLMQALLRKKFHSFTTVRHVVALANLVYPVDIATMNQEVLDYLQEETGISTQQAFESERYHGETMQSWQDQIRLIYDARSADPLPEKQFQNYGKKGTETLLGPILFADGASPRSTPPARERRAQRFRIGMGLDLLKSREDILAIEDDRATQRLGGWYTEVFGDRAYHIRDRALKYRLANEIYPLPQEKFNAQCLAQLARNGIHTRSDLQGCDLGLFGDSDFGEFGDGFDLYEVFFGHTYLGSEKTHTRKDMHRLADRLFPISLSERAAEIRAVLEAAGYTSEHDLLAADHTEFLSQEFGVYGTGKSLFKIVAPYTGSMYSYGSRSRDPWGTNILVEVAEKAWPKTLKDRRAGHMEVLAEYNLDTEEQFLAKSWAAMRQLRFGKYRNIGSFARSVLGISVCDDPHRDVQKKLHKALFIDQAKYVKSAA